MLKIEFADDLFFDGGSSQMLDAETTSQPWQYLRFAIKDLEGGDDQRSCVNGLSNAKRALHLRTESLAEAFGSNDVGINSRSPFPKLIEFVGRCGVVAPRVLRRINKVRNEVEHRYSIPSLGQTEDFVDIVELFLAATDRLISQFPLDIELVSAEPELPGIHRRLLTIKTKPGSGIIELHAIEILCDMDRLKTEAEIEKLQLENESKKAGSSGAKTTYFGSLEEAAYRRTAEKYRNNRSATLRVSEGDEYFEWLALLVDQSK